MKSKLCLSSAYLLFMGFGASVATSQAAELAFTGGSLNLAASWENLTDGGTKKPGAGDTATIEVDGFIGSAVLNFGTAEITMTGGTITTNASNDNMNLLGRNGVFTFEDGVIETRSILANSSTVNLLGGSLQLGSTDNNSVNFGSANGGTMNVGGSVVITALQSYTIQTAVNNPDTQYSSLVFYSDWTGSMSNPGFTSEEAWMTLADEIELFVDETQITSDNFSNYFVVSDGGQTISLGGGGFALTIEPNETTEGNYDFSWPSSLGTVYDLVSTTDLSVSPGEWDVWESNTLIAGTGETITLENITGGGDEKRFFAVRELGPVAIADFDFEESDGGFVSSGSNSQWEWGYPDSDGSTDIYEAIVMGGNSNSQGAWGTSLGDGTNPSGLIDSAATSVLTSPDFDLTAVTGASLTFAALFDAASSDTFEVYLKDATTDELLATFNPIRTTVYDGYSAYGPYDLSAGDGRTVYVEFYYKGTNETYLGVYLDDFLIES
ncbi:MAG: hypothetical protein Q7Q71_02785 [Verrucomicrobiota bacterium JB023]|nr:hypothetical protein [Verrucomicrobiota bacterium JB023]